MSDVLLTINSKNRGAARETAIRLSFGADPHYDLCLNLGPAVCDDSISEDGVYRPGCVFILGGLDNAKNAKEIKVFRAFGEDELRWIAKACVSAAGRMRRTENARRAKAKRSGATKRKPR